MNIRHLVTKSFDNENDIRRSIIFDGMPIISQDFIDNSTVNTNGTSVTIDLKDKAKTQEEMNLEPALVLAKQDVLESPIGTIVSKDNNNILPLSAIYDFKVQANSELSEALPVGTTFSDMLGSGDMQEYLREVAISMFNKDNPNTGDIDVDYNAYYTPYIPLVVLTNIMSTQTDGKDVFFNPEGTVSLAEFLDGLNAIKYGMNSNRQRKKSLDNISNETDYFNEGYQDCLKGVSSFFYNLYRREELLQPITRIELAYIIVLCWKQFLGKYNDLYGGQFYLGINFDWEHPVDYLSTYTDGFDYKISKIILDEEYDIISLNVKDYKSIYSMERFKDNIKSGISAIPIPMFMSLIELDILGIFNFDGELAPIKEVTRGELCYVLNNLAKLFTIKYKY